MPLFGKAEAEWGWPHDWQHLRDEGLIDFREEIRDAPGLVGGKSRDVHWSVTDRGWEVRKDDLAYYRALMDAMEADEASPPSPHPVKGAKEN